jgi:hypothetical protein
MHQTFVVTGTVTDPRTVTLDEPLPMGGAKVRVTIEPLEGTRQRTHQEVMEEIYERQRLRGHVPPTREEVDAYLREERDSWGEA